MAEGKRRIHPIQSVRESLCFSRAKFAAVVGVSEASIEAIEYGTRPMFEELADAIMLRFGIDAASLMAQPSARWPKPKSAIQGRTLKTARQIQDCISNWEAHSDFLNANSSRIFDAELLPKLQQLIDAAALHESRVGVAVVLSLERWINKTVSEFSLKFALRRSATFDESFWRPLLNKGSDGSIMATGGGWMLWSSTPRRGDILETHPVITGPNHLKEGAAKFVRPASDQKRKSSSRRARKV